MTMKRHDTDAALRAVGYEPEGVGERLRDAGFDPDASARLEQLAHREIARLQRQFVSSRRSTLRRRVTRIAAAVALFVAGGASSMVLQQTLASAPIDPNAGTRTQGPCAPSDTYVPDAATEGKTPERVVECADGDLFQCSPVRRMPAGYPRF